MKTLAVVSIVLFALFGMAQSAELKTETRDVKPFDSVDMRGAAKMEVTVGPKESLVIEAEPDMLAEITSDVVGSTLIIDRKHHWWQFGDHKEIKITLTTPVLKTFSLSGSGDVAMSGLKDKVAISISGSGNVKGKGALSELVISLNGAGNIDFADVPADKVVVTVNGAGSVNVDALQALQAVVNGVGAISYAGSPTQISTSINGVGSIKQRQ